MPEAEVIRAAFVPFIVAGTASWSDTWGAVRYGPEAGQIRPHEGQDVFCSSGAPILAPVSGVIEFEEQTLGGRIARLHIADGSYLYFAHLSDWNTLRFASGAAVEAGDVIGYCGNSGNAVGSPPHVHFGWYSAAGAAQNPIELLVGWLEQALASLDASGSPAAMDTTIQATPAPSLGQLAASSPAPLDATRDDPSTSRYLSADLLLSGDLAQAAEGTTTEPQSSMLAALSAEAFPVIAILTLLALARQGVLWIQDNVLGSSWVARLSTPLAPKKAVALESDSPAVEQVPIARSRVAFLVGGAAGVMGFMALSLLRRNLTRRRH
ncbi:MAG: M23 family metallopeptidase [Actinomycetota bacterium]